MIVFLILSILSKTKMCRNIYLIKGVAPCFVEFWVYRGGGRAMVGAMEIAHGMQLAYCTNIHRGESWGETFATLKEYTLRVKRQVCPDEQYGIGLRLSAEAAGELISTDGELSRFRQWLQDHGCYVYTINGFPYGTFHGQRVKEQVYRPDWTTQERLVYTCLLFDILSELLPAGMSGSVSTLPGSFKEFVVDEELQAGQMVENLLKCHRHIQVLRERTGQDLHLGLEPEPLGYFETTAETVSFFERLKIAAQAAGDDVDEVLNNIGVNYDTCHLAVEYEQAGEALGRLKAAGIRISKIHLSSALRLVPSAEAREKLKAFEEDVYLHQVVVRVGDEVVRRFRDLPDALAFAEADGAVVGDEWRVHFHVPLHAEPEGLFGDTREHLLATMQVLADDPALCSHFEIETYTWAVMPEAMRAGDVVDQIVKEYQWCLQAFARVKLA
ncbi:MAG: metabolite traffic protein EboE [Verrucomicrobiales bacterium]|nr:metabolite traffic protein EboE [Verrucomicrobiales bacterium]